MADPVAAGHPPDRRRSVAAPAGRDLLYVLAPAPNIEVGHGLGCHRVGLHRTDAGRGPDRMPVLGDDAEVLPVVTPPDWAPPGHGGGHAVRAVAHLRPDRTRSAPQHRSRHRQRVLAGSSTVPGVGIPTAILSGRLAADRITGISLPGPFGGHAFMISSELRCGRGARAALREAYRRCRASTPQRQDVFPGHRDCWHRATPGRARAVRFRPARRRHPRRFRRARDHAGPRRRTPAASPCGCSPASSENPADDDPMLTAVVHTARTYHLDGTCSTTSSRPCGWI